MENKNSGNQQSKFSVLKLAGLKKFSTTFSCLQTTESTKYGLTSDNRPHPPSVSAFQASFLCNDKNKPVITFQSPSGGALSCKDQNNASDVPTVYTDTEQYSCFYWPSGTRALLTRDTHKAYAISTHEGPPPPSPWPYSNILAWTCPLSFSCLTVFNTW